MLLNQCDRCQLTEAQDPKWETWTLTSRNRSGMAMKSFLLCPSCSEQLEMPQVKRPGNEEYEMFEKFKEFIGEVAIEAVQDR